MPRWAHLPQLSPVPSLRTLRPPREGVAVGAEKAAGTPIPGASQRPASQSRLLPVVRGHSSWGQRCRGPSPGAICPTVASRRSEAAGVRGRGSAVRRPARRLRVRRFRPRCFLGRTVTVIRGQHRRVRRSRVGSSLSGDLSGVPRSWSGLRHIGGKWVSRCLRLRSSRGRLDRRVALGADVFCSFRSVLTCRLRGLCAS